MKGVIPTLLSCFILSLPACGKLPAPPEQEERQEAQDRPESTGQQNNDESMTITVTIGDKTFTARIEDSETGKAFMARLPLSLDMSELNGNEKYCYGVELPRADKRFDAIAAGDLMLYSGHCIVLFYGSAGGYSYTRIGRLTSTDGLKEALGAGSIRVTFLKEGY